MTSLKFLHIYDTQIIGTLPAELGNLSNLLSLIVEDNNLTGALPGELTGLTKMWSFLFGGNDDLCAPPDSEFQAWLAQIEVNSINYRRGAYGYDGPNCDEGLN